MLPHPGYSQKNFSQTLYPEIRIYQSPSTITYEASIRSGLLKDYYITMSNIDRSDYYNIKFQKKPFMIWIWISVIFISFEEEEDLSVSFGSNLGGEKVTFRVKEGLDDKNR